MPKVLTQALVYWVSTNIKRCTLEKKWPVPVRQTKLWLSPSAKQHQNPCSEPPTVYQDLSMCHDWLVKKAIVNLPINMKETRNVLPVICSLQKRAH